jgi:hypothetical protein
MYAADPHPSIPIDASRRKAELQVTRYPEHA